MTHTEPVPEGVESMRTVLAPYAGRPVFFDPVAGNNGDDLIMHGAILALRDLGLDRVGSPADADAILINGSFKSDFWPMATEQVKTYSQRFPDKPLVILPSTYLFNDGSFEAAFAGRSAPATLMCRERYSLDHIMPKRFPAEVRFGLDDDLALWLRDSDWIRGLKERSAERHNLIVERMDHERSTVGADTPPKTNHPFVSFIYRSTPESVTQPIVNSITRMRARRRPLSDFGKAASSLIQDHFPDKNRLPDLVADIARRRYTNFDGYARLIADSGVVVATRMHVGILGAMLGKPSFLVRGTQHKIIGVYEQSLTGFPNLTIIDRACRPVEAYRHHSAAQAPNA